MGAVPGEKAVPYLNQTLFVPLLTFSPPEQRLGPMLSVCTGEGFIVQHGEIKHQVTFPLISVHIWVSNFLSQLLINVWIPRADPSQL